MVNTVEMLDDIYVKQNHLNTKHPDDARMFAIMGDRNIVFMDSFHKDYNQTRKVLSAAFFKSKLSAITSVIKNEVCEIIEEF